MSPQERSAKLSETISVVLGVSQDLIKEDTSPDTLSEWDSVAHLNLVVALEDAFGVSFSPDETMELTSVRLINLFLDEKLGAA